MAEIPASNVNETFVLFNNNNVANSVSDSINIARQRNFSWQTFAASGAATLVVQVSLEPSNPTHWADLGTMDNNDIRQAEGQFSWMRVKRDGTTAPISCIFRRGLHDGGE